MSSQVVSEQEINLAINSEGLEKLALDFMTSADNLSILFDKLDEKFETLESYLECDALEVIKEKYQSLKDNYSIIKKNAISYSDDMSILNRKMAEGDRELTNIANQGKGTVEDMKSKVKEVD